MNRPRARVAAGARTLNVGGLVRLSTADYPGNLSAVVFCQGCAWRCEYCHNPHLQGAHANAALEWGAVRAFLETRRGLLDAVVFSGGEPTQQPGLARAIREVKAMGYAVGLHTAGVHPRRLAEVLPLLDWVGMDVKAPLARYPEVTGIAASGGRVRAAVRAILASGVNCEFRTTVHWSLIAREDLLTLVDELAALGVRRYALQAFRSEGCASSRLNGSAPMIAFDDALVARIAPRFEQFVVRGA